MKLPSIKSTVNYDQFMPNPYQRTFTDKKVKDLVSKMKMNGYPPSMAISVYLEKGKFTINTGHHRLEAAKQLGIPVLFVIEDKWTPQQLVDEGTSSKTWDILSATQTYSRQGKSDYHELLVYYDKGIPLAMAASMLAGEGAGSGNTHKKVMNGSFIIKERSQIDKCVSIIDEFSDRQPTVKTRPFLAALSKCMFTSEFDLPTFCRRLKENPTMLEKTSNTDQMLKLIEEIYNFRANKKIPLAFLAQEKSNERGLLGFKR